MIAKFKHIEDDDSHIIVMQCDTVVPADRDAVLERLRSCFSDGTDGDYERMLKPLYDIIEAGAWVTLTLVCDSEYHWVLSGIVNSEKIGGVNGVHLDGEYTYKVSIGPLPKTKAVNV